MSSIKLHLSEMTWPEVRSILQRPNVVLIPVGSTEQHGAHLPLNVDSACATYLSEKAAEKANTGKKVAVVVAPALHYTEVQTFAEFPGNIGISLDTETRLIADITRSFLKQGFNNLLFVNGHASNVLPISHGLREVSTEFPQAGLFAVCWWSLGFETIPLIRKSQMSLHAEELETSLSLLIQEKNVQMEKAVKEIPEFALSEKWVKPDFYAPNRVFYHSRKKYPRVATGYGVMGDPTVASKEMGQNIAEAVVKDLVDIIFEIADSEKKS